MKELRVEYTPIESIEGAPRNPKRHDIELLEKSIGRFGVGDVAGIVDERTGRLVAGHGRVETLRKMKASGAEPPAGVLNGGPDWKVPLLRGWASKSDRDAEAFLLAHNRTSEVGGWSDIELAEMLKEFTPEEIDVSGFEPEELTKLLDKLGSKAGQADPDELPATRDVPRTKLGELWQLGEHRLLCGDSASESDVARLMDGNKTQLIATDPPYGVDFTATKNGIPRPGFKNAQENWGDIANDGLKDKALQEFLEKVFVAALPHLDNAAWYLWHAHLTAGFFSAAAAAAADVLLHRQIIWKKPGFVLTRSGMYHWAHEPCFYGWVKGKQPRWFGEKNQTSVWEVGRDAERGLHPTQKPVELFTIPIKNHVEAGAVCYEPFSGSGSQLIAAEMTGRRCFAMEIDPRWATVSIDRWERFTGKSAVKL